MNREELGKVHRELPLLLELRDSDSGLTQKEIGIQLDHPKSTVHRKIRHLEDMDLVRKSGSGYELTSLGSLVTDELEDCLLTVKTAAEREEFLDIVEDSDLRLEDLRDADVTRATEANPFLPRIRLAEVARDAEEARVLAGRMTPGGFEVGRTGIRDGTMNVELVIDSDVLDSFDVVGWYGEEVKQDLEDDGLEVWVHDDVRYRLGVLDGKLCLGAEDENGMPNALLETTDDEAVGWAHDVFEEHRQESDRLTVSDV